MMYPFMILDDETEITHSEMLSDGTVKIIIMVETLVIQNIHWSLPDVW